MAFDSHADKAWRNSYPYLLMSRFLFTSLSIAVLEIYAFFVLLKFNFIESQLFFGHSSTATANLDDFGIFQSIELIKIKSKSCSHHFNANSFDGRNQHSSCAKHSFYHSVRPFAWGSQNADQAISFFIEIIKRFFSGSALHCKINTFRLNTEISAVSDHNFAFN